MNCKLILCYYSIIYCYPIFLKHVCCFLFIYYPCIDSMHLCYAFIAKNILLYDLVHVYVYMCVCAHSSLCSFFSFISL